MLDLKNRVALSYQALDYIRTLFIILSVIWIFTQYILLYNTHHSALVQSINFTLVIIHLYYFISSLYKNLDARKKKSKKDVYEPFIKTSLCACGHIPIEKGLVHCVQSGVCFEKYDYYGLYFRRVINKENLWKLNMIVCIGGSFLVLSSLYNGNDVEIVK